jgi:Na+/H+ antiporter NhaD/arsenite permease-like protein
MIVKILKLIAPAFLSRKFLCTVASIILLLVFHHQTIADIERLPVEKAAHIGTVFMITSGTLGAILVGYLGFSTLQTRFGLSGVAQAVAQNVTSKSESVSAEKVIHEYAEKFKADPSYRPIEPDTTEEFR